MYKKEERRSLNYNVKSFGEPTWQKVYARTTFCQCRRTETNTTAQRPYQGGFTIGNKLNNVSQISKEVLNFVGKLWWVVVAWQWSEHWQLNPETVGSIPFSFSVCLICWMQPWVKDAGAQDWGQYNCSAKPAASIPTVTLTLSWGLYRLVCPYTELNTGSRLGLWILCWE